jgi:hypothetical protein
MTTAKITTSKKTTTFITDYINSTEFTDSIIFSDSTDPYNYAITNGKLIFNI